MLKYLTLLISIIGNFIQGLVGASPAIKNDRLLIEGRSNLPVAEVLPTATLAPMVTEKPRPTLGRVKEIKPKESPIPTSNVPWGVAQQINEHTWTMKIGEDPVMANPKEVMEALNEYRRLHGRSLLTWNDNLASYAQSRADYFFEIKRLDEHKGFMDYLENQEGFDKIGFTALGENASYGYRLSGVHLIEWIFAGDKPHDDNQLNNNWGYVGVGIKDTAVCLIFGSGKR